MVLEPGKPNRKALASGEVLLAHPHVVEGRRAREDKREWTGASSPFHNSIYLTTSPRVPPPNTAALLSFSHMDFWDIQTIAGRDPKTPNPGQSLPDPCLYKVVLRKPHSFVYVSSIAALPGSGIAATQTM
jgi:hypothetical protein